MFYAIWVPLLIAHTILLGWLSYKNNIVGGYSWWMFLVGLLQIWIIVSRYTKNLFFDALLYDSILAVGYALTLLYLTRTNLSVYNIAGLVLLITGLVLVRA